MHMIHPGHTGRLTLFWCNHTAPNLLDLITFNFYQPGQSWVYKWWEVSYTDLETKRKKKKKSSASQFKVWVICQITGIDVQCCTMTFVSSAWSLFIWDWKNRVLIQEYKWLKFDKKKKILSQNIKSHTATGLENWAIGSTFADLYSSPLNSESRSKRNIH